MSDRAIAPVIGVLAMVGITVVLAASVAMAIGDVPLPIEQVDLRVTGTFDPDSREISLRHAGGDPVSIDALDLHVGVDDEPLVHQPPVPFFAATGFVSGPTGPFNPSSDEIWAAGEAGSFRIALTNDPVPTADSTITVRVAVGDRIVARLELDGG